MDIETYKNVGEIIRMIRMAQQVEEVACVHVERLLADCMEVGGIAVNQPYDFGSLPGLKDETIKKIEVKRTSDKQVLMVFQNENGHTREMSISALGIFDNTMQIFNHLSNRLLENLSPEIKKAMDDAMHGDKKSDNGKSE